MFSSRQALDIIFIASDDSVVVLKGVSTSWKLFSTDINKTFPLRQQLCAEEIALFVNRFVYIIYQ